MWVVQGVWTSATRTSTDHSNELADFPFDGVEAVKQLEEGVAREGTAWELVPEEGVGVEVEKCATVRGGSEHTAAEPSVQFGT